MAHPRELFESLRADVRGLAHPPPVQEIVRRGRRRRLRQVSAAGALVVAALAGTGVGLGLTLPAHHETLRYVTPSTSKSSTPAATPSATDNANPTPSAHTSTAETTAPPAPSASSAPPASPTSDGQAAGAGSGTRGQPQRCQLSQLAIRLTSSQAGATNRGVTVVFVNTSASPCTMAGYPGFALENSDHKPVQGHVRRGSTYFANDPGPHRVRLDPGEQAHAGLGWNAGSPSRAGAPTYPYLEITPPGDYHHVTKKFGYHVNAHGLTTTAVSQR
jgi:hypothetical protein